MINFLGKTLTLLFTMASVMGLVLAFAIFMQFPDLGWTDPRRVVIDVEKKDGSDVFKFGRVASLFDKTAASLFDSYRAKEAAVPPLEPVYKALRDTEEHWPTNRLFFDAEMRKIKGVAGNDADIVLKDLENGANPFDKPRLGKPKLGSEVPGVTKTIASSKAEHTNIMNQQIKVTKGIDAKIEDLEKITLQMAALVKEIDREYKLQEKVKEEFAYLQPAWARALEEARSEVQRQNGLKATIEQLKVTKK